LDNRKEFLQKVSTQLHVSSLSDWYKVKAIDIVEHGGRGLLHLYNGSVFELLKATYPEYSWDELNFDHIARGYWDVMENQKKIFG
jgi:hypothetical protein